MLTATWTMPSSNDKIQMHMRLPHGTYKKPKDNSIIIMKFLKTVSILIPNSFATKKAVIIKVTQEPSILIVAQGYRERISFL